MDYRSIIESKYNRESWQALLHDIFKTGANFRTTPIAVDCNSPLAVTALQLGVITLADDNKIAVFEIKLADNVDIVANRVGIRNLLINNWKIQGCVGAFMFCYRDNESVLRFSYVSSTFKFNDDGKMEKDETDTKRFTYLLGAGHRSRTAIKQFEDLRNSKLMLSDLTKAFSIEALSDRFFKEYKDNYENIIEYVTGKRMVKVANKWEEKVIHAPNAAIMDEFSWFDDPEKAVRDYVKKLMGRIVFLQFIQKKGWLGVPVDKDWGEGDKEYLQNLYNRSQNKDNFIDGILELLFNDINTKRENDIANPILGHNIKIPYLNGGLFDQDKADKSTFRLPQKYMDELFKFFNSYNFTIDENDPDDAEIGVDPEMLGRIFENLLENNKDKGTFYTPKEIVQYMCRESLIAYLQTDKNDDEKESIREFVTTYNPNNLNDNLKSDIDQKLIDVKICDPAIGSGAFPMGLLKELFACRSAIEGLDNDNAAEIKKHIIQNNIYGVDIEKGAVDIARLRFWLALIVDEKTPYALPNMDFKIMQGNSLMPTFNGKYVNLSDKLHHVNSSKIRDAKKELFELQNRFYDSEGTEKNELLIRIKYLILEIVKLQMDYEYRAEVEKNAQTIDLFNQEQKQLSVDEEKSRVIGQCIRLQQILSNTSKSNKERASINIPFFDWKIMFSDIFNTSGNNGFNIVIGNPPYIDSETMTVVMPAERALYTEKYKCARGNWDMFVVFVELGAELSTDDGIFSYIIPNKIIAAKYADKIRERIADNSIIEIRDYSRIRVFQDAAVYPCTIVCQKGNAFSSDGKFTTMKTQLETDFSTSVSRDLFIACPYWDVYFQTPDVIDIVKRVLQFPNIDSLGNFELNAAATVSEAYLVKDYIFNECNHNESFKVINTGTIDPYRILWGISPMTYIKGKYLFPRVKYQDVKLMNKARYEQSLSNKIIVAGMSVRLEAVLDTGCFLAGKSTTIITSDDMVGLKVLLAILNSTFATWLTRILFNSLKMAGGYLNYGKREVMSLPIPPIDDKIKEEICNYVDAIHDSLNCNDNENFIIYSQHIDNIIYKIYGLSDNDVSIICQQ